MNLTDVVGTVIDGKYHIERMLGRGGMGAVFFAKHLGTDRPVALKIIVPQYATDASFLERFRREARAAGRFRHPNIVDVTDFGHALVGDQEVAYLVMEYLDGCSLEDILIEQPILPVDWTVEVLDQLSLGIGELHRNGIIHRDLKPGNIWLEPNLRGGFTVKLLDFGLAKIHDYEPAADDHDPSEIGPPRPDDVTLIRGTQHEATTVEVVPLRMSSSDTPTVVKSPNTGKSSSREVSEPPTDVIAKREVTRAVGTARPTVDIPESPVTDLAGQLTVVGSVLGTPAYMSPEQCRGEVVTAASDVYSLGVITYQMLAGGLPFEGTQGKLMAQHMHVAPQDLDDRNSKVPRAVANVVMSALAKDPADRPASVGLYAAALKSKAESAWELVRRALILSLEHFPVFVRTTAVLLVPYFVVVAIETWFYIGLTRAEGRTTPAEIALTVLAPLNWVTLLIGTIFARGVITLLIAQILLAPLKRVRAALVYSRLRRMLGPAFQATLVIGAAMVLPGTLAVRLLVAGFATFSEKMDTNFTEQLMAADATGAILLGTALLILTYVVACDLLQLANAILAEELPIRDAIRRSRELRRRVPADTLAVGIFVLGLPIVPSLVELWFRDSDQSVIGVIVLAVVMSLFRLVTVAINAALVATLYFKERQTAGESIDGVLACQYVSEPPPETLWQRRLSISLETLRSTSRDSEGSGSGLTPRERSGSHSHSSKA